jgi:hypothetical protein
MLSRTIVCLLLCSGFAGYAFADLGEKKLPNR